MPKTKGHGSALAPGVFAALPSDVLGAVASKLGDKDRWAMMGSCKAWFQVVEARPDLWPVFNVRMGKDMTTPELRRVAEAGAAWRVHVLQRAYSPLLAMQTPVVLLSLPPAVRLLEIHVPCGGPVFEALQHCTGLREVAIFGDATGILCHGHGRHTVTKLRSLQLTCKRELYRFDDSTQNIVARQIPSDMFGLLLEASQLTHLTLSSLWSDDITSLCYQLPKLSSLSLKVYECSPDDAEDVVAALERAHSITALCLGLCACHGVEDWRMADRMLHWRGRQPWVQLPAMARLAPVLTRLQLAGAISLPPDWRQLSSLRELQVENEEQWACWAGATVRQGQGGFVWGEESLAQLAALEDVNISRHGILPDPAVLATAPRLMRVAAPSCSLIWCVGLQRRRADVIVNGYSLADTNRFFAAGTDYPSGHGDNGHDSQDVGDPASSDDLRDPVTAYLLRGDLSEESSRGDGEASSGSEEGGRSGGSGSHSGSEEGDGEGSSDSSSEEGSRGSGEGRSGSEGAVSI